MRALLALALSSVVVLAETPLEDKRRPVATSAALTPAATASALKVPAGFRVELIAGEPKIVQPIAYTLDDRGRLWVVENTNYPISPGQPKDRILVLEDTKGTGTFDKETVFWDKATFTSGIAVGFGGVWLGSPPNLLFIPIKDGEAPAPAGAPEILLDGWEMTDTHETLNDFIWGPDGWLYGTQGIYNRSLVGKPGCRPEERIVVDAAIWRFHPTRKIFERWSEGGSNQWGVDWNDHGEAFFEACVIPHMWHAIQGARYQRQSGPHPDTHTYDDIKTIAWGRYEKAAYCGAMIYLGGVFPKEWRDQFFFHDIHMNKLRCETMIPVGSGYRSEKKLDFVISEDRWFRGLSPQYGPDGGVFINDWYDKVPCHQQKEYTDRSNGRIYKIVTDAVKPLKLDLAKASDAELVAQHLNQNEWYVRHARRLLQERGANAATTTALEKILLENPDDTRQLRALWTLHAQSALSDAILLRALSAKSDAVRGWAVTCACDNGRPGASVFARISDMAREDASAVVRRRIASAIQRLNLTERWPWIEALAAKEQDVNDQNIPFLLWYALEPAAAAEPTHALTLIQKTPHKRLAEFTARRLAAAAVEPGGKEAPLEELCQLLSTCDPTLRSPLLTGLKAGLAGLTQLAEPKAWPSAYSTLARDADASVRRTARELAVLFGNADALKELRETLASAQASVSERTEALATLSKLRDAASLNIILSQASQPDALRKDSLNALAAYSSPEISTLLLRLLPELKGEDRNEALNTLIARPDGARALLSAIEKGHFKKDILSAPLARKIQGFKDHQLSEWIEKNWGKLNASNYVKRGNIEHLKKFLDDESVLRADIKRGRELFRTSCGLCHQLFGTGGDIGPHLTGGYTDLEYLLQNIIDPNAVIGNDYQLVYITLKDGSLQAGIVGSEKATSVTLKVPGAPAPVIIAKDQIKSREVSPNSLMPEGLLNGLEEPDVRSLFLYLRQNAEAQ
jgi:putative membrane-bound dehydrogenase-like protein